jgi:hypothetical protein
MIATTPQQFRPRKQNFADKQNDVEANLFIYRMLYTESYPIQTHNVTQMHFLYCPTFFRTVRLT